MAIDEICNQIRPALDEPRTAGVSSMQDFSAFSVLALSLAVVFWAIGFIHLLGPRFLRDAFEKWDYGTSARLFIGCLEIGAALMLAHPETRVWGIALAAIIMFGAVITLLSHEQYLCAIPSVVLMAALIPATLAVPRDDPQMHFATVQTISGQQIAQNGDLR
jgi:uncharacterized membrane protein